LRHEHVKIVSRLCQGAKTAQGWGIALSQYWMLSNPPRTQTTKPKQSNPNPPKFASRFRTKIRAMPHHTIDDLPNSHSAMPRISAPEDPQFEHTYLPASFLSSPGKLL